jgi:hypothetical protein
LLLEVFLFLFFRLAFALQTGSSILPFPDRVLPALDVAFQRSDRLMPRFDLLLKDSVLGLELLLLLPDGGGIDRGRKFPFEILSLLEGLLPLGLKHEETVALLTQVIGSAFEHGKAFDFVAQAC